MAQPFNFVSSVSRNGPVNATTLEKLSPDLGQLDWPGCLLFAMLIFDVFNRHVGILAKGADPR